MDIVTAYLNSSLDNDIYMKISERFKMPEACNLGSREHYSVKLNKFVYRLKQYGRICYNHLSEYLLKHGYKNDTTCPCIFMKRYRNDFIITAVYVDDLSIIGTPEELLKTINYLMEEFEMKDLGRTKFCIGLQIEHLKMTFLCIKKIIL